MNYRNPNGRGNVFEQPRKNYSQQKPVHQYYYQIIINSYLRIVDA